MHPIKEMYLDSNRDLIKLATLIELESAKEGGMASLSRACEISTATLSNIKSLKRLPEKFWPAISDGSFKFKSARALARLGSRHKKDIDVICEVFINKQANSEQAERLSSYLNKHPNKNYKVAFAEIGNSFFANLIEQQKATVKKIAVIQTQTPTEKNVTIQKAAYDLCGMLMNWEKNTSVEAMSVITAMKRLSKEINRVLAHEH